MSPITEMYGYDLSDGLKYSVKMYSKMATVFAIWYGAPFSNRNASRMLDGSVDGIIQKAYSLCCTFQDSTPP